MIRPADFNRLHGRGAFTLLRKLLDDPKLSYERIGASFGLTRQRIAQLANQLGIHINQRLRERRLTRPPSLVVKPYPPHVAAVIKMMKRSGLQVSPYDARLACEDNLYRRSQTKVFVNGVLCAIQVQPARKRRPRGREYARFDVGPETRRAKAAVFTMRLERMRKLYLVPTSDLRNVSAVYIPADGKYAVGSGKKPRKDWTVYRDAWHLLRERMK